MKFYNREKELKTLQAHHHQSSESGKMIVMTGRRRVGKTLLALEFSKNYRYLYLFISKKSELLLCQEFLDEIKKTFDVPVIGHISSFKDIFALLLEISKKEPFTLIIDEFQEFYNINPSIFSDVQRLWDLNKSQCRLNLIFIGSVYTLMNRIFQNSKEPLFQRADRVLYIKPFQIKTLYDILSDHNSMDMKNLFDLYLFTGGIPRYIDILVKNTSLNYNSMLDFILEEDSPFLNEGKNLLIEEFGKEYGMYFSILELISSGKTARAEIESILECQVGGYLERLENDYNIISKQKSIDAKPNTRSLKYRVTDNFLNFWFRFIYRHRSAIETGNFKYVKQIIDRDYAMYSGLILERFFHLLIADTGQFNNVGSYWEKGNQNEIDLVAVNDMEKKILIAEIKLNKSKIRIELLKNKSKKLLDVFRDYQPEWVALGLEDVELYLKNQ